MGGSQVAAAKGLVVGSLSTTRNDGSSTEYGSEIEVAWSSRSIYISNKKQGMLVPKAEDVESLDISATQWILVVEKEACVILPPNNLG